MQTRKRFNTGQKIAFLAGIMLLFLTQITIAQSEVVTEQNLKNAIMGKQTFTNQELQELDVNGDGKVDVADLVYCIKSGKCDEPVSLVGEHVGIMVRDNASLIEGQSEVYGQMPFAIRITSETPLKGEIDNRSVEENPLGHYSLYFPDELIPITFLNGAEKFRIEFTTTNSNLAPDSELTREMLFEGEFDGTGRVLAGTYEETITGFKDNQGADIPITLTGKFMIVFGSSDE